ncbi:TetR family transcriptional regulator [Microbacterium sp. NPDC019599]|uniref:TetR/AcrR family transcriptional regulator n=1 Tax=Microbacterium sp. NPDC019599 TaxID=3154690 RepID=UPI0033DED0ED
MDLASGSGRPYRSELRERQAAETRHRVIESALRLFSRQGYRATTFAQIAADAGVSVETVQKHGPKTSLLQSAVQLAAFGVEGESDIFATDVGRAILAVRDADEFAALLGELILAVNAPSAGMWMTIAGAARGDEELSAYQSELLSGIRSQVGRVLRYLDERGWLRSDLAFDDLVEAVCVITGPEAYVRFVEFDGKSAEAYQAFVTRMMRETVLNVTR